MKTGRRNTALALIGLGALSLYILACTSFSPDDTKVLYPAFDPASGTVGMAVYDRVKHRGDLAFVAPTGDQKQPIMRAQWLDNRRILVVWASDKHNDGLHVAVVPWGEREPIRSFVLTGISDSGPNLSVPVPVVGDFLFTIDSSNRPVRLNLRSGELTCGPASPGHDLGLYADPAGRALFFVDSEGSDKESRFGQMNPETFEQKVLLTITNETHEVADGSFFVFDSRGKRVAFVAGKEDAVRVVVLENGAEVFTRPLARAQKLLFSSGQMSPKGDMVWASYVRPAAGTNQYECGLMEIPLDSRPIRETVILPSVYISDEMNALFLQAGVAHDGSAAAIASTYLFVDNDQSKPSDCALFFIDLKHPSRKVTKVPIPVPAVRTQKMGK